MAVSGTSAREKTKVVVRKLPPAMTEAMFKQVLDSNVASDRYTWFSYYQGKAR